MTEAEFIDCLRSTPRKWYVTSGGAIRMTADGHLGRWHCPISAVTGWLADYTDPQAAGERLGLDYDTAEEIVIAADSDEDDAYFDKDLRRALLDACGLKEKNG